MICLDFDGVIADSHAQWLSVLDAALLRLGHGPLTNRQPFRRLRPLTFAQLARDLRIDPNTFNDAIQYEVARQWQVPPLIPGMRRVMASLASHVPLAIVSASQHDVIEQVLSHHQMTGLIAQIHGSDSGRPKTEVLTDLRQIGAVAMVGDAESDIAAGQAAGLVTVGVLWGWQETGMLAAADHCVATPRALLSALRPLLSRAA